MRKAIVKSSDTSNISPAEKARRAKLAERARASPTKFKQGKSGNPAGRPKGAKAKLLDDATRIKLANEYGITPLEFCMSVIRDTRQKDYFRLEATKVALPYMHQKKAIQLEGGDPNKPVRFDMAAFKGLPKEKQATMLAMLVEAGIFDSDAIPT